MNTKSGTTLFAAGLITAALASGAIGQQEKSSAKCSSHLPVIPMWQVEFTAGRHASFDWFLIARRNSKESSSQIPLAPWRI